MSKVTVLMSVYNGEKYLREAINSILNQTFKDFEFLIINDGSTDKTSEILQSYSDPRIKIVNNKENIGLTKSLNKGLKLAKGEYIARQDADDVSCPERLEMQLIFMEQHKKIVLAGSSAEIIDANGKIVQVWKQKTNPMLLKWKLILRNSIVHSSAFFRREAVIKEKGYNPNFRNAQDFELWSRLSDKYQISNIKNVLMQHRTHDESISQSLGDVTDNYYLKIIKTNIAKYIKFDEKNIYLFMKKQISYSGFKKIKKMLKYLLESFLKKNGVNDKEKKLIKMDYRKTINRYMLGPGPVKKVRRLCSKLKHKILS